MDVTALRGTQIGSAASANGQRGVQGASPQALSSAEQRLVDRLKTVDRSVRDHEAAHMRVGGSLITHAASYTYTYGPDGKQYAVGGEVGIDVSATGKPQEDIDKGRRVEAAALAPADPSAQDYAVASDARRMVESGQAELAAQRRQERVDNAYGAVERGTGSAGGKLNVTA